MKTNDQQVWLALSLLSRANEEVLALGGVPGSLLDTQEWINKHLQVCPKEFAFEDWSSYQPAIRKIQLVLVEQPEHLVQSEQQEDGQ